MVLLIKDDSESHTLTDGITIDDVLHALALVKSHREKYREKHKRRYVSKKTPKEPEPEILPKRPRGRPRKIPPVENLDGNLSG
jgi:hypothetical protein